MFNIYVASSWRNEHYPEVVRSLIAMRAGRPTTPAYEVYDFRNPAPGNTGFAWSSIDPNWGNWTAEEYAKALDHPLAVEGFEYDITALAKADLCVLVLPSGRSASWEYGYFCGQKDRKGIVYMPEKCEPELMYRGSMICATIPDLYAAVSSYLIELRAQRGPTKAEIVADIRRELESGERDEEDEP